MSEIELTIESRLTGHQVAELCRGIENGDFEVKRTDSDKLQLRAVDSEVRVSDSYRDRQPHDYDVDDRWARIRVEVLGQEYTDAVRVCEQFPDLPDGITVYVEHVDAIDLKSNNGRGP